MHILGKILNWFVVVLAIAAVVLTGQMFQVRNSWDKQADSLNDDWATVEKDLNENRYTLRDVQAQLQRTELGWDRYWKDVPVQRNEPPTGALLAQVGTNQGLQEGMTVYAFQPNADMTTYHIGAFTISRAQENRVALQPAWRVRPGSPHGPQTWDVNQPWRLRELIPSSDKEAFSDLDVELTLSDELYVAKLAEVKALEALTQVAQRHLTLRLGELNGNAQMEKFRGTLDQHMIDGLIKAIKDDEEIRNQEQAAVDQLRRDLKTTNEEFERLRAINGRLAKSLPGPKPPTTAKLTN